MNKIEGQVRTVRRYFVSIFFSMLSSFSHLFPFSMCFACFTWTFGCCALYTYKPPTLVVSLYIFYVKNQLDYITSIIAWVIVPIKMRSNTFDYWDRNFNGERFWHKLDVWLYRIFLFCTIWRGIGESNLPRLKSGLFVQIEKNTFSKQKSFEWHQVRRTLILQHYLAIFK